MITVTIELDENVYEQLEDRAEEYGLTTEQYIQTVVENHGKQPAPDFNEAAQYVLAKNSDLYRRLA